MPLTSVAASTTAALPLTSSLWAGVDKSSLTSVAWRLIPTIVSGALDIVSYPFRAIYSYATRPRDSNPPEQKPLHGRTAIQYDEVAPGHRLNPRGGIEALTGNLHLIFMHASQMPQARVIDLTKLAISQALNQHRRNSAEPPSIELQEIAKAFVTAAEGASIDKATLVTVTSEIEIIGDNDTIGLFLSDIQDALHEGRSIEMYKAALTGMYRNHLQKHEKNEALKDAVVRIYTRTKHNDFAFESLADAVTTTYPGQLDAYGFLKFWRTCKKNPSFPPDTLHSVLPMLGPKPSTEHVATLLAFYRPEDVMLRLVQHLRNQPISQSERDAVQNAWTIEFERVDGGQKVERKSHSS